MKKVLIALLVVAVAATALANGGAAPGKKDLNANFAKGIVMTVDMSNKVLTMKALAGKIDGTPPEGFKGNDLKDRMITVTWDNNTKVSGVIAVNAMAYVIFETVPDGNKKKPKYHPEKKSFNALAIEITNPTENQ